MFMTIVQSVQQLIVDNTHALESVLTFRGQLKPVTPTNHSSKALPWCQYVRPPSLVPVVSAVTAGIVSSSILQYLQTCIISVYRHRAVHSAISAGMYHRQLCDVFKHVSQPNLQCLQACNIVNSAMFAGIYHRQLFNVAGIYVSSSTLRCFQAGISANSKMFAGMYHRQLCDIWRHVSSSNLPCFQAGIIAKSTMFAGMYHRQICDICRHVPSSTLRCLQPSYHQHHHSVPWHLSCNLLIV
jgi:hypothetical protein